MEPRGEVPQAGIPQRIPPEQLSSVDRLFMVGLGASGSRVKAWCGVVWCGVVWCGVAWRGVAWRGVVWCGVV